MKQSAIAFASLVALAAPAMAQTSPTYMTPASDEMYTSKVKGLSIYNQDNKSIGEIEDVAFSSKGVDAFIVSVGGFLGMGEHYVAIAPAALNVSWDASAKKWSARMNATADQLKAAPEFKYPK